MTEAHVNPDDEIKRLLTPTPDIRKLILKATQEIRNGTADNALLAISELENPILLDIVLNSIESIGSLSDSQLDTLKKYLKTNPSILVQILKMQNRGCKLKLILNGNTITLRATAKPLSSPENNNPQTELSIEL